MCKSFWVVLFALLVITGCSPKKETFVLMPDPDTGVVGEIIVTDTKGASVRLNRTHEAIEMRAGQVSNAPVTLSQEDVRKIFSAALESTPEAAEKHTLYFVFDKVALTEESKKQLPYILRTVKERVPCEISIIGYTDTAGDDSYNQKLSLKRGPMVQKELLSLGIPAEMIQVIAQGEKNLVVPTDDDIIEPQNRRIEILIQ